jgi:hypothetical protein
MPDLINTLEFEDQEVVYLVLSVAIPRLTVMQTRCMLLSFWGLTQELIGRILGVGQSSVSRAVTDAFAEIERAASEIV